MLDTKNYDVCFYHKCCPDGIGAALPFHLDFIPCIPIRPSESYIVESCYKGKRVVFVDVTPEKHLFEKVLHDASHVCVIDHHKTAIDIISGKLSDIIEEKKAIIHYDVSRSAAQISWSLCFPKDPEPFYISVIGDRDLWKWEYPNSREIGNAMYSRGYYKLDSMARLYCSVRAMTTDEQNEFVAELVHDGTIIEKEKQREVDTAVSYAVLCEFEGRPVRLVCSSVHKSDIGDRTLATYDDCDFAAIVHYDYNSDEYWISFRADDREGATDLLGLVEKYGGGGHPKACGMTIRAHEKNIMDVFVKK